MGTAHVRTVAAQLVTGLESQDFPAPLACYGDDNTYLIVN
jgi:hypothetical protein